MPLRAAQIWKIYCHRSEFHPAGNAKRMFKLLITHFCNLSKFSSGGLQQNKKFPDVEAESERGRGAEDQSQDQLTIGYESEKRHSLLLY